MESKQTVSLEFIHDFIRKTADLEIEKLPKTAVILKAKEDMRRLATRRAPNQNFTFTAGEMNAYLG